MAQSIRFLIVATLAASVASQITPTPVPGPEMPRIKFPYTLSGCYPAADPDRGKAEGCSCENWDNYLPLLASSGKGMCAYSTITAFPSYSNPLQALATTVAMTTNGFEVEYWISSKTVAHKTVVDTVSTEWFPSSTASKAERGSGVSLTFGTMGQGVVAALAVALGVLLYI